jgi:hypothetical protein
MLEEQPRDAAPAYDAYTHANPRPEYCRYSTEAGGPGECAGKRDMMIRDMVQRDMVNRDMKKRDAVICG